MVEIEKYMIYKFYGYIFKQNMFLFKKKVVLLS